MDDFYIGWQPHASQVYARRSRLFVWVIAVALPFLAAALVFSQRGFSGAVFEYGKLKEIEGVFFTEPVPMLRLDSGASLVLVGAGKHGADMILEKIAASNGASLHGKRLRLTGTLIYHDGKGLFELSENQSFKVVSPEKTYSPEATEKLGMVTLCGEIADPKCFFGVMKPGEGKPHRSCAVRCIAGGIPPVLKVEGKNGMSNYYLLKGSNGEEINQQVLDYVADGVKVQGQLEFENDWNVLKIDPTTDILRERPYWIGKGETMCKALQ